MSLKRYIGTFHSLAQKQPMFLTDTKHEGRMQTWRFLSLLVAVPAVGLLTVYNYILKMQHAKTCKRPPFVKYEYLRLRKKPFPWGDGNKTLFHNPLMNALPEGYEDEIEGDEDEEEDEEEEEATEEA